MYNTPDEMLDRIVQYFQQCEKSNTRPLVSRLAFVLGFKSTQALINYEGYSEDFHGILARAKNVVEQWCEQELEDHRKTQGMMFVLNRLGWTPKQHIDGIVAIGTAQQLAELGLTQD